jgi:hypothetical protein
MNKLQQQYPNLTVAGFLQGEEGVMLFLILTVEEYPDLVAAMPRKN